MLIGWVAGLDPLAGLGILTGAVMGIFRFRE
jgi:hypothetical protein